MTLKRVPGPMHQPQHRDRAIAIYPPLLFAGWIVAWMLNVALRDRFRWDAQADTIYWIVMKVIVWVLPALLAIRFVERASVVESLELQPARGARGVRWGVLVGLVLYSASFP
jgi:hypothetical protein